MSPANDFASIRWILTACILVTSAIPLPAEEATNIELPGEYSQFTIAGRGKFIAFQLETPSKIVVYDIARAEIAFEIDDVSPGDLLAGGAEKLIAVSPGKMVIRRFDLATGERDKLSLIAGDDAPREALMGSAGSGPLLLVCDGESQFYSLETLNPMDVEGPMIGGRGRYGRSVHVSARGRTFGTIPTGYGPVGYAILHVDGYRSTQIPFGGTSDAIRWAQPTADGYLVMQPGGGIVNGNGRGISAAWLKGAALAPSVDPAYFLDVRVDAKDADGDRAVKVTVCSTADRQPLVSETGFDELVPSRLVSWHDIVGALRLGHEWRIQYIPAENLLVTLPAGNKRLVLREFNIRKKLKATDDDFLYVHSVPPLTTEIGKHLDYRIRVHTSGKGATTKLEDGPEGAALENGRLRWRAPTNFGDDWARFLVRVSDDNGQEMLHSFEVAVSKPSE